MDENTVLEIINSLRNQIAEIKTQMREQHNLEIERIESAHENEKSLLEQKYQEEIGGYQDVITQQKGDLDRLERENGKKDEQIEQIESQLIEKNNEIGQKLEEMKAKTVEYNFLQAQFREKVAEITKQNNQLTTKEEEIVTLKAEIKERNQEKTTMQTTINKKNSEISRLNNIINDKGREISRLKTNVENEQNECKRLNKYINDETVKIYDKGDYSKITYITKLYDNLDENTKNFVMEITHKSFNMYDNNRERADYIRAQLGIKFNYKGEWAVIIHIRNHGHFTFSYLAGYASFYIGEYVVTIIKTTHRVVLSDKK